MANADALSRLPLPDLPGNVPVPGDHTYLLNHLQESVTTSAKIRNWTDNDPVISRIRNFVQRGWTVSSPDPSLTPYFNRKDELSVLDGCLLWGSRIIVPKIGQDSILKQLHDTHPGISRMKALARSFVWWPGMDSDIQTTVRNCVKCQENRATPSKAPLHPWEWPHQPWARVHIDHAGPFLGHIFLIIVDAHSKWIDAHIVSSTSAEATIKKLTEIFAIHGVPEQLVSDNGTGFASQEFATYTKQHDIRHTFVSPYHPSSNGLAERAVQTFKQGIKKLEGPIENRIARFLFRYRITPQTSTNISPSELLMGRRLRCELDLLHPDVDRRVEMKQEKMINMRTKHQLRFFKEGERVYTKSFIEKNKWIPVVVESRTGPVSYRVKLPDGRMVRRHLDHLRYQYDDCEIESNSVPQYDAEDWPTLPLGSNLPTATANQAQLLPSGGSPIVSPTVTPLPRQSDRIRNPIDRFAPSSS